MVFLSQISPLAFQKFYHFHLITNSLKLNFCRAKINLNSLEPLRDIGVSITAYQWNNASVSVEIQE